MRAKHVCPDVCHYCPDMDGDVMPMCYGSVHRNDLQGCTCDAMRQCRINYTEMKRTIREFCEGHGWVLADPLNRFGWTHPDGYEGYHWTAALEDSLCRAKEAEHVVTCTDQACTVSVK